MWRITRKLPILVVLALAAIGCAGDDDPQVGSVPSAVDDIGDDDLDDSAWGQYLAMVAEQGETPETALIQFSLLFGPVDGVDAPATDDSVPHTGTSAIEAVERHWDDYTQAQQLALGETYIRWLGADVGAADAEDEESMGPRFVLARESGGVTDAERDEWERLARDAEAWLHDQLGDSLTISYEFTFAEPNTDDGGAWTTVRSDLQGPLTVLTTLLGLPDPSLSPGTCEIVLEDVREARNAAAKRSAIAHELFHCWSATFLGVGDHAATEPWVQEGIASWVGETYAPGSAYASAWWGFYFEVNATEGRWSLFNSAYSAIGFWSAVDQLGGDLFGRIPAILESSAGGGDIDTYEDVMGPLSPEAQAAIASTAAMRDWGPAWRLQALGVGGVGRQPAPRPIAIGGRDEWAAGIGTQVNRSRSAQLDEGWAIVRIEITGAGRVRWESGQTFAATGGGSAGGAYCVGGPCVCESTGEPPPTEFEDVSGDPVIHTAITGIPGDQSEATLEVLGEDELCDEIECRDAPILLLRAGPPAGGDCITICPAGTWIADAEDTARFLTSLPGASLAGATLESGTVTVTFGQDWSFEQLIENAELSGSFDRKAGRGLVTGHTSGQWSIQDDGTYLLQITAVETRTQVIVGDVATDPVVNSVDPSNLGGVITFEPTCTDDKLNLVANTFIPVPQNWTAHPTS